jgi:hypothetical protein
VTAAARGVLVAEIEDRMLTETECPPESPA